MSGIDGIYLDFTHRNGAINGQLITGGLGVGDSLTLRSTAAVGTTDSILLQRGNNGSHQIGKFYVTSDVSVVDLNSHGASKELDLRWLDNGTPKWTFYKTTGNNFNLFDHNSNQDLLQFLPAVAASGSIARVNVTWPATTNNSAAIRVDPTITGSADGMQGITAQPLFKPSANVAATYANLSINQSNPPAGVTITNAIGGFYRSDYAGSTGAVTLGMGCYVAAPFIGSTLKPTSQVGLKVDNQGAAGITTSYGIIVVKPTGSTNNFYFGIDTADNVDPTGGGGAATGRISIEVAGVLRYIPYY